MPNANVFNYVSLNDLLYDVFNLSGSMPDLPIYHTLTNIYTAMYELVSWYTLTCSDSYMPTNLYSPSSLQV